MKCVWFCSGPLLFLILEIVMRGAGGPRLGVSRWLACLQDIGLSVNGSHCMLGDTFGSYAAGIS